MKVLKYVTYGPTNYEPGDEINVTGEIARDMIERGLIEGDIKEIEITEEKKEDVIETSSLSLEQLTTQYKAKFGKNISARYKNDKDYILSKLNS